MSELRVKSIFDFYSFKVNFELFVWLFLDNVFANNVFINEFCLLSQVSFGLSSFITWCEPLLGECSDIVSVLLVSRRLALPAKSTERDSEAE